MTNSILEDLQREMFLLTAVETSVFLRIKLQSLYSLVHYKRLPQNLYIHLGTRLLFKKKELFLWVTNGAKLLEKSGKGGKAKI